MNIFCRLFGHRPRTGYYAREGGSYFSKRFIATDGLNVEHWSLHDDCRRCGKEFQVGRVHLKNQLRQK